MSGASSSSDPFGRRSAGTPGPGAPIRDHFREQLERKAGKRPASQGDAFAPKAKVASAPKPPPEPQSAKVREAPKVREASAKPVRARSPESRKPGMAPAPRDRSAEDEFRKALAAEPAAPLAGPDPVERDLVSGAQAARAEEPAEKSGAEGVGRRSLLSRTKLKLVKRQDEAEPQVVLAAAASGAEVRRLKKAGKSSSLVLVSNSNVEAAAEPVTDSSGGGPSEGEGGEASPAAARAEAKATKKASRSGGAPPGGGGGPRAPTPAIDRAFNQDDLMAALMVLALLLLAAMYFMRGNGAKAPQPLMQAANIQPAAVPAPAPVGPPPDPHGDKPIDLTPKSAMPAPAPEPVCPSSHTLRAWFCTDQTQLTDAAKASLEKDLADWGQCFKNKELQVAGYADTRGPSEYNTSLGGARATVVAEYLKSKGIRVAGMKGIGELSGLTDNENCANQRRVDITFAGEESEAPMRTCAPPKDFAELVCG